MARVIVGLAVLLFLLAPAAPGAAQPFPASLSETAAAEAAAQRPDTVAEDQELGRPLRLILKDIGGDLIHLAAPRSLAPIVYGGLAAAIVSPVDDKLTSEPGEEWARWSEVFDPGTYIGDATVLLGGAVTTYAVGRFAGRPRVSHVGRDLIRTIAVSQVVVQALKAGTNRDRPDLSNDHSFPSGHAATTFASAVVLQRHLGKKWAVLTYGVATYVAASRMHENRHHLSDVVMGASLGIASGLSTTRHATTSWDVAPAVVPGGAALVISRRR